ncbi:LCP family protein required for cell wall assembly [Kitasatospora sp. GAS204A]|uniref:LCP family protein n=1 Tax=unclassified Kitasatospora TaxID=2633591 RepID=UPI0024765FFC|nr:LCP family protein [Kitasatospora sp. GAS204B]MDH6118650.1 LCP family protein required for cell wall assembly [Kitasatospora sp. GAS204B]
MTEPEDRLGRQRARSAPGGRRVREHLSLGPGRSAPRSRRRRVARIAGLTAASLVLTTAGAGFLFYEHLNGNLSIFDSSGISASRPPAGPGDGSGSTPVNVLLLGSDSRAAGNEDLAGGDIGPGNSDTAILLHVYADHRHAVGVSIPRDALVDIPPCLLPSGRWTVEQHGEMFNSAFAIGGYPGGNPACAQNTVEALTGLRVDHTIVVDFKGFAAITTAIGGVPVCVPNDVDGFGIRLRKGRQTVAGAQALAFVRARHGIGDGSDIGRMKRQQAFLSALIQKVQSQGFNLTTLLPLADAATRALTVDAGLGTAMKLASFAQSLHTITLRDINFVTVPWQYAGDRVSLVHPDADTLWTLLRQDRTLDGRSTRQVATPSAVSPVRPADPTVPITVQNGTATVGLAVRAAHDLLAKGYQDVTAGLGGIDHAVTSIGYPPGRQADAEQLARYFPGADVRADTESTALTLTLGTDYATAVASAEPTGTATASATGAPTADAPSHGPSPGPSPGAVPSGIAQNTRPADADICAGLTYG